jgi:hypothetical protein
MSQSPDRAAMILARFNAAQSSLVGRLRDLPAAAAERAPSADAWSAAQIGWHVALAHDLVAGVLLGSNAMARPAVADFRERFDPSTMPARIKNPPALDPPAFVGRDSALEKLRASAQQLTKAIASLSPERGAGYTVALPFGTLSLFQLADFAALHVVRHVAQIDRAVAPN